MKYTIIVFMISCVSSVEQFIDESLQGKWLSQKNSYKQYGELSLEFDGQKVLMCDHLNRDSVLCTYSMLNDSILETQTGTRKTQYRISIHEGQLRLRSYPLPKKPQKIISVIETVVFVKS